MKKYLIELSKKSLFLRKLMRKTLFIIQRTKYMFFYIFNKVDDHVVIFESFNGRSFCDSPKAIYLEMLNNKKYKDYKFIWCFNDVEKHKYVENERTKVIKYKSNLYYKYYSISKYFFTCSSLPNFIKPKKNQVYVQCWHGTPLKRLGFDIKVSGENVMNSVKEWEERYERDAKRYKYMLSPSAFCTEKFISAFNLKNINKDKCIIEKGYPRNDFLYKYTNKDINTIKKNLGIDPSKKVILYAPTWRDNQHDSKSGYTYKNTFDLDLFRKNFKDYIILFRTHYLVSKSMNLDNYKDFVIDASNYEDVNDLYVISDILITDYSSVFFDYANLKRPMLFYMYDLDEYKGKMRDFYISFDELPGPIIKDNNELIKEIKNISSYDKTYKDKYIKFNNKYNYLDSKNTSKNVLKEII